MASMDVEEARLGFPHWKPLRRRFAPESPFFAPGNIERELLAKQIALDLTEDEKHQLREMVDEEGRGLFCPIVGCGSCLSSLEDFEDHYNARHTASCSVCSRVYPTSRLLSIHYECLVEGCGLKFKNYKSRQQHLVDKHKFPTSFEFFKKALPSKKQRQKKNQRRQVVSKKADSSSMQVDNETMDGLVSAVSKLSTSDSTPSAISFGRRPTRGVAFVPRAVQLEKKPDSA